MIFIYKFPAVSILSLFLFNLKCVFNTEGLTWTNKHSAVNSDVRHLNLCSFTEQAFVHVYDRPYLLCPTSVTHVIFNIYYTVITFLSRIISAANTWLSADNRSLNCRQCALNVTLCVKCNWSRDSRRSVWSRGRLYLRSSVTRPPGETGLTEPRR